MQLIDKELGSNRFCPNNIDRWTSDLIIGMPHEDKVQEEEQKARTAYDLFRMRLDRLQKNIVSRAVSATLTAKKTLCIRLHILRQLNAFHTCS